MPFSTAAAASREHFTGRATVITPTDSAVVAQRFAVSLGTADLASGVVGAIGILPAGAVPLFLEIDSTDVDTSATPAFAFSVGVLNADETAIQTGAEHGGAAWFTGRQEGRSAGVSGLLTSAALRNVRPTQTDRRVGIHVTAASATAAAGVMGLTLYYRMA